MKEVATNIISVAQKAKDKFNADLMRRLVYTDSLDNSFSVLLNEFIGNATHIDIEGKVIDFSDGSVIAVKSGVGVYVQAQDTRYK